MLTKTKTKNIKPTTRNIRIVHTHTKIKPHSKPRPDKYGLTISLSKNCHNFYSGNQLLRLYELKENIIIRLFQMFNFLAAVVQAFVKMRSINWL